MTGPSLQKTALFSFVLHLSLLIILVFVYGQTRRIVIPPYYTVNLVGSEPLPGGSREPKMDVIKSAQPSETKNAVRQEKKVTKKEKAQKVKMDIKQKTSDSKLVEKKIAELAAKKQIEKIAVARKTISLKAQTGNQGNTPQDSGSGKGEGFNNYYARITQEIHRQWSWRSDKGPKNIEAVIAIRIFKDGTATVQKIEKSSGNIFFDREALRAIAKSSPLTPPPYEMDIGIRFYL